MKKPTPKNFANGAGYKAPVFARSLLSVLPSVHQKDQPPTANLLAGPYDSTEYKAALKQIEEYSRAGKSLIIVYTRTQFSIAEDLSRELLAVDVPAFPSSPVQAAALPGPRISFKLAPFIAPLIPRHATFVDLLGGGAALLMIKPRSHAEVINDSREEISHLFEMLRSRGCALAQLLALTPWSPDQFRKSAEEDHFDPLERARRTVLRIAAGIAREDWRTYQNALPGIVARLQGVEVTREPIEALLARHDRGTAHFHLDLTGGDPFPEVIATLNEATVSIIADSAPPRLPFRLIRHPLPDSHFSVWIGSASDHHRKRTATVPAPRQVRLPGLDLSPLHRPAEPGPEWVASVRDGLGYTPEEFAALLGVPLRDLRRWEKPATKLPPAAERLVSLAETHPEIF